MEYKTLILVDNSENLTPLNKDIIRQTVKYMLENSPKEMKIAVAQIGTDGYIKYLADYDDTSQTKINSVDNISFLTPPVSAMDIVADVVLEWKNHDLADRNIVVFSNADVNNMSVYTLEELILELETLDYPIYTVGCVQEDNISKLKTMASLSRVSDGIIVYTDEGSDASIEKQITEKIFNAMEEKRNEETGKSLNGYNEGENTNKNSQNNGEITVENNYSGSTKDASHIIYEKKDGYDNFKEIALVSIVLVCMFFCICIMYLFARGGKNSSLHKRRHRSREYERNGDRNTDRNNGKTTYNTYRQMEDMSYDKAFDIYGELKTSTRNLTDEGNMENEDTEEEESDTRILYQSTEGVDITLEDRADPTKYFRANIRDRVIIGRSKKYCDIPIPYDDSVSGKHCELFLRGESVYVRDLSSSNGTMVNQQKVYQDMKINNGDVLRLGQLSFYITVRSNMGGAIYEF